MKKLTAVILAFIFVFGLCACGKHINSGFTENVADYGIKALEVVDEFLNGDMSASSAASKLKTISYSLQKIEEDDLYCFLLRLDVDYLVSDLNNYEAGYSTTTKKDVKESRDDIYNLLYK